MPQVCIYPKQAAQLTGNQYTAGKRLLQRIRTKLGKPAGSYVSVGEFCQFTGLPEAEISRALNGVPAGTYARTSSPPRVRLWACCRHNAEPAGDR